MTEIKTKKEGSSIRLLADIRKQKKKSQSELAKRMGISRSQLTRLEKKRPDQVNLGQLQAFAEGLGCSPIALFGVIYGTEKENYFRSSLTKPLHSMPWQKGVALNSLIPDYKNLRIHYLTIEKQSFVEIGKVQDNQWNFYLVIEGQVIINAGLKEIPLTKHDTLFMNEPIQHNIENNHAFKKAELLCVSKIQMHEI